MDIEVNEENIDVFGLVRFTGNPREELLSRAAEASQEGYILSVKIPDEVLHTNVFEHHVAQMVDNDSLGKCRYELQTVAIDLPMQWICIVHNSPSQHAVMHESSPYPCTRVEPAPEGEPL